MKLIDATTKIPLSLAVVAIGGAAVFITTLHDTGQATASSVQKLEARVDLQEEKTEKYFHEINLKIGEILGELNRIRK